MRHCQLRATATGMVCDTCGRRLNGRRSGRIIAVCGMQHRREFVAVGDFVAAVLSAVGVTKDRVSKVMGRDCGCQGRQAAWNQAGFIAQYKALKAVAAVAAFLFGNPGRVASAQRSPRHN